MSSCKAYGYWGGIGAAVTGTRLYNANKVDREVTDLKRECARVCDKTDRLVDALAQAIPFTPAETRVTIHRIMTAPRK